MKVIFISLVVTLISITSCEKNPVSTVEPEEVEKEVTVYVHYSVKVQVKDQNGNILYDAYSFKTHYSWTNSWTEYFYADINGDIPFVTTRKFTENDTIPDIVYGGTCICPDDTTICIPNTFITFSAEFPMYRGSNFPRFVVVYPNYP